MSLICALSTVGTAEWVHLCPDLAGQSLLWCCSAGPLAGVPRSLRRQLLHRRGGAASRRPSVRAHPGRVLPQRHSALPQRPVHPAGRPALADHQGPEERALTAADVTVQDSGGGDLRRSESRHRHSRQHLIGVPPPTADRCTPDNS